MQFRFNTPTAILMVGLVLALTVTTTSFYVVTSDARTAWEILEKQCGGEQWQNQQKVQPAPEVQPGREVRPEPNPRDKALQHYLSTSLRSARSPTSTTLSSRASLMRSPD